MIYSERVERTVFVRTYMEAFVCCDDAKSMKLAAGM
jgi:hypothetical protein